MDIRKFFPTIDHEILKHLIRRAIKGPGVLWLCDLIIDNSDEQEKVVEHFPGDDLLAPLGRTCGIPIGNLTSQFFANVYLDALDHFVKERMGIRRYLRYVDDFCCFGDDKPRLRGLRTAVREFLFLLRLRLNESSVRRHRRRIRTLQRGYAAGALGWPHVEASLRAWSAHAEHGTTGAERVVRPTRLFGGGAWEVEVETVENF
ncbi:MAG: RNA-directed DNA polymerase [Deltaproteobacteria bacterium]|nr:RNA-directed DNA polymerase [Deltaproteobacteria bacterium]